MQRQVAHRAVVILLILSVLVAGVPIASHFEALDPLADRASSALGRRSGDALDADAAERTATPSPGGDAAVDGAPSSALSPDASLAPPGPPAPLSHLDDLERLLLQAGALSTGEHVAALPLDVDLPALNPLRAALLQWIAVTGSDVPPAELAQALADADALPLGLQRDLATLLVASSQATLLQRSALASLSPEELEFLETHPEAVRALVEGRFADPDAERVALIASKVDVARSVQASLLLLAAVKQTRDSLQAYTDPETLGAARAALAPAGNVVDVLRALDAAQGRAFSQADKLRLAGDLLAAGSGLAPGDDPRPYAPALHADAPLPVALVALIRAADPTTPEELPAVLAPELSRANALPDDVQRALALIVLARAETVASVRDAALAGASGEELARLDAIGALKTLSAMEQALPVLEKFALVWDQMSPAARRGVTEPDVAYADSLMRSNGLVRNSGSLGPLVAAAGASLGLRADPLPFREQSFQDAYVALARHQGVTPTDDDVHAVAQVAGALPPEVRRASTLLMQATLDASLARERAFAGLTPAEAAFLVARADEVAALVDKPRLSDGELALVRGYSELALRVDGQALLEGAVTLATATDHAKALLDVAAAGGPRHGVLAHDATPVRTGALGLLDRLAGFLARLSPVGTARAQVQTDFSCERYEITQGNLQNNRFQDCNKGVILWSTNVILILDDGASHVLPEMLGGPNTRGIPVILDLGGDDTYAVSNGAIGDGYWCVQDCRYNSTGGPEGRAPAAASVLLDYGGNDHYAPPRTFKDGERVVPWRGTNGAGFTGIGMLVDFGGNDVYDSFSHSQGFGWLGVGVLADRGAGNDRYVAPFLAQGATYALFGVSVGLLVDDAGDDRYTVTTGRGQGYGTGGALLDLAGADEYAPADRAPKGIDTSAWMDVGLEPDHLLAERANNRIWLDGPTRSGLVQHGLGVDTELTTEDRDGDLFLDFLEAVTGSGQHDFFDTPDAALQRAAGNATRDADGDGFADFMERALGTDPEDATSAPASIPLPPVERIPVIGETFARLLLDVYGPGGPSGDYTRGDKILDLRVPFPGNRLQTHALCDPYLDWSAPRTQLGGELTRSRPNEAHRSVPTLPRAAGFEENRAPPFRMRTTHPCADFVPAPARGGGNVSASRDGDVAYEWGSGGNTGAGPTGQLILGVSEGLFALGDTVRTTYRVDYLVSVDLGGNDVYLNRAGGGGFLTFLLNHTSSPTDAQSTFVPIGYVTLDVDQPDLDVGHDVYDVRGTSERRFALGGAQGAAAGILVDTQGRDSYFAGADAQGTLAGLLLDLRGDDVYRATDRAQGAAVTPGFAYELIGSGQQNGIDRSRRVFENFYAARPSVLLDFNGTDSYTAWNRSQGYASQLLRASGPGGAAPDTGVMQTIGLLADLEGHDRYEALGRSGQGVARGGAAGLLVDLRGDDRYVARSAVSHGAIEPETLGRREMFASDTRDLGGLGLLADLGGADRYVAQREVGTLDRSGKRQNNLTYAPESGLGVDTQGRRLELTTGMGLHADLEGSHRDSDGDNVPDFFEGVAGTNWAESGETPFGRDATGHIVHLPSARLAIGGTFAQRYERDYAFVVDFGGANEHANNAGGPVLALPLADGGSNQQRMLLNAFPVTFVYEVANAPTTYRVQRDLAQGVGYFTVGLVVDEGGADSFAVDRTPTPVFPSRFTSAPPSLNGVIDAREWRESANTSATLLAFRDLNASAFEKNVSLYVANDLDNLYLAVSYVPARESTVDARGAPLPAAQVIRNNWFAFQFDSDHDHDAKIPLPADPACRGQSTRRLGADGIRVHNGGFVDQYLNATYSGQTPQEVRWIHDCANSDLDRSHQDVRGRATFVNGRITIELQKPLRSPDPQDLNVESDGVGGWVNPTVGFRMAFGDRSSGQLYAWPPGSAGEDGQYGSGTLRDRDMGEEMRTWAALTFASHPTREAPVTYSFNDSRLLGQATTGLNLTGVVGAPLKPHGHARALAQGVGVGGVGILAMLGNTGSSATYVGDDYAQGAGKFGGIGVLYDAGGSDRYVARDLSQGAARMSGVGILIDAEGNDVYEARASSQGWADGIPQAPTTGDAGGLALINNAASAFFLDASGDDAYVYGMEQVRSSRDNVRQSMPTSQSAPYNDRLWSQGPANVQPSRHSGIGLDYRVQEATVYGVSPLYTQLTWNPKVIVKVGTRGADGVCRDLPATVVQGVPRYLLKGTACFRAFAYFDNYAANAAFQPVPPGVTVDRVDFLLDQALLTSVTQGVKTKAADFGLTVGAGGEVRENYEGFAFSPPAVDTTTFDDGPHKLHFLTYFSTTWNSMGWHSKGAGYEKADQGQGAFTPQRVLFVTAKQAAVLLDNPARVAGTAAPALPGNAGAAFSPYAVGAPREATFTWAVSHDLVEDRHAVAGYYPTKQSAPCPGQSGPGAGLCNTIPFYFHIGEQVQGEPDRLDTLRNDRPVRSDATLTYESGDSGQVLTFEQKVSTLREAIRLEEGQTIRLLLNRTPLVSAEFETTVIVTAGDTTFSQTVKSARMGTVPGQTLVAPRELDNVSLDPESVARTVLGAVDTVVGTVGDAVDQVLRNGADPDPNTVPDQRCSARYPLPPTVCVVPYDPWTYSAFGRRALDACWALGSQQPGHMCDPDHTGLRVGAYTFPNFYRLLQQSGTVYHKGEGKINLGSTSGTGPVDLNVQGEPQKTVFGAPSSTVRQHNHCLNQSYASGKLSTYNSCMASGRVSGPEAPAEPESGPDSSHTPDNWNHIVLTVPPGGVELKAGSKLKVSIVTEYAGSYLYTPHEQMQIACRWFNSETAKAYTAGHAVYDETVPDFDGSTKGAVGEGLFGSGGLQVGPVNVPLQLRQRTAEFFRDRCPDIDAVPFPEWVFFYGTEGRPARIEFDVATDPATRVVALANRTLFDEHGNVTGHRTEQTVLATGLVEGDIRGCALALATCRQTAWTAAGAPEGRYLVNFSATTVTPPDHPLAGKRDLPSGERVGPTSTIPVLVDKSAPVTTIDLPQTTAIRDSGEMRSVLGRGFLTSGTQFPIRWKTEDPKASPPTFEGAGLERVAVWVAPADADGAIPEFDGGQANAKWKTAQRNVDSYGPGVRQTTHIANSGQTTFYVAVVARDRVGNMENVPETFTHPRCTTAAIATAAGREACITRGVHEAVMQKINLTVASADASGGISRDARGLYRIDLDLGIPVLTGGSIDGAHEGVVNGIPRLIVRAGEQVALRVCAIDGEGESGIERVNAFFVYVPDDPAAPILSHARPMGAIGGGCYEYTGWGQENTDKAVFPDGAWAVGFEAFDRGANRAELTLDEVYLDSEAPLVSEAQVVLPQGQTAVRPGDRFDVLLRVQDNIALGSMTLDAASLTTVDSVDFARVTIGDFTHRATVRVDRANVANGVYDVEWRVRDAAGNLASGVLQVSVNARDFQFVPGSFKVTAVSYDSATLEWETTEPTSAKAAFGFGPFDLRRTTPTDLNFTTKHTLVVRDLAPTTRYFVKAISASAGGIVHESEVLDFETTTALFLESIDLKPGDAVSGAYDLSWRGGSRASGSVKFTLDIRKGAGPWEFLTTTSGAGSVHNVTVNTTRFLDGSDYQLRITAESGRIPVNMTTGPFTFDNTPPALALTSSRAATRDVRPVFAGSAKDALSGLDASSFRLVLNGVEQDRTGFVLETAADGATRFTYTTAEPLPVGRHAVEIAVADLAGVVRKDAFTLIVDLAAPELLLRHVGYDPGPAAAKPGGLVLINVSATDGSGVKEVLVDASELALDPAAAATTGAGSRAFTRVPGTDYWTVAVPVPETAADGERTLRIRAVDLAGNSRSVEARVLVDGTPPTLDHVIVEDIGFTSARILARASEPVTLSARYAAPQSTGEAKTDGMSASPTLPLRGLLPSRTYSYTVTATDAAGNAVTSAGTFATTRDVLPPSQVPTLRVIDLKDGRLRLEWSAATDDVGVAAYRVYRGESSSSIVLLKETTDTFLEEVGLPIEKSFSYRVAALDWGGNEGPMSPLAEGASTSPPVLTGGIVSPNVGSARTTTFIFEVSYRSPGGVPPQYVRAIIDGVPRDMVKVAGVDAAEGLTFRYETALGPTTLDSPHTYQFEASDGRYIVKFPRDQPVKGPLVSGDLLAENAGGLVNFAKRIPLVGAVSVLGAVGLAAAAIVAFRRRSL